MILELKQQWIIDSESFEDIPQVMEKWFTIDELRQIFEIKQEDYERWNNDTYGVSKEELEKPYNLLSYLIDNDGLMLERDSVIQKLLHYKKGYFDFSSNDDWEYYAVIKEYNLDDVSGGKDE